MIRAVESALLIFASVSPFLITLLTKPSGSGGLLTATAAGAGVPIAGIVTESEEDAFRISSAYPGSEQARINKTVTW